MPLIRNHRRRLAIRACVKGSVTTKTYIDPLNESKQSNLLLEFSLLGENYEYFVHDSVLDSGKIDKKFKYFYNCKGVIHSQFCFPLLQRAFKRYTVNGNILYVQHKNKVAHWLGTERDSSER